MSLPLYSVLNILNILNSMKNNCYMSTHNDSWQWRSIHVLYFLRFFTIVQVYCYQTFRHENNLYCSMSNSECQTIIDKYKSYLLSNTNCF